MDEDRRALVTHLMAEITARLEDAQGLAVAGQSSKLDEHAYRTLAAHISSAATDVHALAEAVSVLALADYGVTAVLGQNDRPLEE